MVLQCGNFADSGVAELLSAMAAGWNAKLIVETWSQGNPIATSIGLAVAARHTCGSHVCIVPDERSRLEYESGMRKAGIEEIDARAGEPEELMPRLAGVDFLVVDSNRREFTRVLRHASLSGKGAVVACKNATQRVVSGFGWQAALGKERRVVRSVLLPVGKGLDIAHVGSSGARGGSSKSPNRWIKHVDQRSGEEHVFRGQ